MNQRYYIATPISPDNFAGTKARRDIETLAESRGMQCIEFRGSNTANRSFSKRIALFWLGLSNWIHLGKVVAPDALVLFQYPHYPLKSAVLSRLMMRRIQRKKRVRFVALVHDLNSIRKTFGKAAQYSDSQFLRQFDYVVCHNEHMLVYLQQQGFDPVRLFSLGVFDYLADEPVAQAEVTYTPSVTIAGNLSREKSAYLHELLSSDPGYLLYLYGAGLDATINHAFVQYEGFASAETLPGLLLGAFGLVWDGDCMDTCSGNYGAYLTINNPHKLSLYLCAGIPVIIWSGAALSGYITQNGLGFCVDALTEIGDKLKTIDAATYRQMRERAAHEGVRIRNGYYFNQVMDFVELTCFKK